MWLPLPSLLLLLLLPLLQLAHLYTSTKSTSTLCTSLTLWIGWTLSWHTGLPPFLPHSSRTLQHALMQQRTLAAHVRLNRHQR